MTAVSVCVLERKKKRLSVCVCKRDIVCVAVNLTTTCNVFF